MATTADFQAKYLAILTNSPYMSAVLKPGRVVADVQYYAYNGAVGFDVSGGNLLLNVPQTNTFDTQSDSDFILTTISAAVQEVTGGPMAYNDNVTLQIQDLSTGKFLFNVPTVMGLVTGAGGFPFVLPAPRVFNPNTSIAVTVENRDSIVNDGAGLVNFYYAFQGTRVFYAN